MIELIADVVVNIGIVLEEIEPFISISGYLVTSL
jgi:hypothetical protein